MAGNSPVYSHGWYFQPPVAERAAGNSGCTTGGSQLSRVTYSLFKYGDVIAGQQQINNGVGPAQRTVPRGVVDHIPVGFLRMVPLRSLVHAVVMVKAFRRIVERVPRADSV